LAAVSISDGGMLVHEWGRYATVRHVMRVHTCTCMHGVTCPPGMWPFFTSGGKVLDLLSLVVH
jgi:hypothetical protein